VGKASNRQGGAYTKNELDLWQQIKKLGGEKRHISTHTNTNTGQVKVVERDSDGNVFKVVDEFKMDNFDEIKSGIEERFK